MNLLYFSELKKAMKGNIRFAHELQLAKPYVVPTALIESYQMPEPDRNSAFEIINRLPFKRTWIEFIGETAYQRSYDWFYVGEISSGNYECGIQPSGGEALSFGFDFNQEKFIYLMDDIDDAGKDELSWSLVYLLGALDTITRRENKLGIAKVSRIIRGRILPFDVTYVRNTNVKYPNSNKVPEKIDWKHSWEVCGHWVRIRGLGKDRDGKRIVKGMTWRNPHIKGSGPLISKTRVMLQPKEKNEKLRIEMS